MIKLIYQLSYNNISFCAQDYIMFTQTSSSSNSKLFGLLYLFSFSKVYSWDLSMVANRAQANFPVLPGIRRLQWAEQLACIENRIQLCSSSPPPGSWCPTLEVHCLLILLTACSPGSAVPCPTPYTHTHTYTQKINNKLKKSKHSNGLFFCNYCLMKTKETSPSLYQQSKDRSTLNCCRLTNSFQTNLNHSICTEIYNAKHVM